MKITVVLPQAPLVYGLQGHRPLACIHSVLWVLPLRQEENEVPAAFTTLSPADVSAGYSVVTASAGDGPPLYADVVAFSAPQPHEVHKAERHSAVLYVILHPSCMLIVG